MAEIPKFIIFLVIVVIKVVGAVDQMDVDVPDNPEKNLGSAPDPNSTVKTFESEKEKSKRKFYVGSQSLGFRRDNMEASF